MNHAYISRSLGHANPSITLNIYGHLWDAAAHGEQARKAIDVTLGNVLETSGGNGGGQTTFDPSENVVELPEVRSGGVT
jgi:hypothetical protein